MTSVLFIGDPHFKIRNVEYIPLFISKVESIINLNNFNFVVVAGDLLDNHDVVDVEPLNLATEFINILRQKVKTFVLVGNHDYKNNQQFLTNHHWMNALKQWDNVVIVDDVTEFMVNDYTFLFLPYVPPGRFVEAIKTKISIDKINDFKAIFAHQEFFGCKMGPIESVNGDKWMKEWPMVISGHIHNKQWCQSNIYYPGSAMQHAFGQSTENTISSLCFKDEELMYEELDLKMPKLTIKYISMEDIMKPLKFKITEFKKYKIVLQGTQEEFQTFKKNQRYKQLLEEGFKITFKIKNDELNTPSISTITKKGFLEVLNEKIEKEDDSDLFEIYKKFLENE